MALRMKARLFSHLAIISIILLAYNNCSKPSRGTGAGANSLSSSLDPSGSSGLTGDACDEQLQSFFDRGYHPFLMQNCASCHSKGPGSGQFANADLTIAFRDFMQVGYSSVSTYATSNHAPRPSLDTDLPVVNSMRVSWVQAQAEYDKCKGVGSSTDSEKNTLGDVAHFSLPFKNIPPLEDNKEVRLEYDLHTEMFATKGDLLPQIPGAKFSFMIKKEVKGVEKYYTVHSPKIFNSSSDIHIKTLLPKINGRYIYYSTNFRFVDTNIPAKILETDPKALVSTGALIIAGAMSPDDQISFDFENIEVTNIPPPPAPVQLTFASATPILVTDSGQVLVEVKLDNPASEAISFSISADNSPLCGTAAGATATLNSSSCLPEVYNLICPSGSCTSEYLNIATARSVVGTAYNRFDWDYRFGTTSMVFGIGETSKIITIGTSKDIRYEPNRLLKLKLELGIGTANLGISQLEVVFNKRKNPIPGPTEITYSKLMNPLNGIFTLKCQNCHNSKETVQQGGFDLSDYQTIVDKGILVPGADVKYVDPNTGAITKTYVSKLFKRMNPQDPDAGSYISPMPVDKFLQSSDISYVEKWLMSGAKNN